MAQLVFVHGPGAGGCADAFEHPLAVFAGSLATAATPAPILARLRETFAKVRATEEWRSRMEMQPYRGTNEEFMAKARKDAARLAAEYKRLNLSPE